MWPFQEIYDAIKDWKTPNWLKVLLQEIQDIIVSILLQIGEEYLESIRAKIIEVDAMGIPNKDKFNIVFTFVKQLNVGLKDSAINLIIEALFQQVKQTGVLS